MDMTIFMFLVALIIVYLLCNKVNEPFVQFNDPKMFINSCLATTLEKEKVSKLLNSNNCDIFNNEIRLSNRDLVNKKIRCKNLLDKKIVLDLDQPNICNRVAQIDKAGMFVNQKTVTNILEGPEFLQSHATDFMPNTNKKDYVSL